MTDRQRSHPYDRHVGRYGKQLARGLIELAEIMPSDRVLDVGCGPGQLTTELAVTVGSENVAALDPSEDFVETCRDRVPGGDVRVGAAEALPFGDGCFDAVLAQLVVNLVDDSEQAVREMVRVSRPFGTVAACVWDDLEMPLLRSFWDAAEATAPDAWARVDDQAQVGLPNPGLLRDWWERAGVEDVRLGELRVAADYEDFGDLWFSFSQGMGHSGQFLLSLDPDGQAALRADVYRRLGAPRGPFQLAPKAISVRGTCPA